MPVCGDKKPLQRAAARGGGGMRRSLVVEIAAIHYCRESVWRPGLGFLQSCLPLPPLYVVVCLVS